jgi:hypothetical protein
LGNGPGVQLHGDQREGYRDSGQFHAATMARFSPSPAPDWGQSFAFGGQLKNFPLKFRPRRKFSPDKVTHRATASCLILELPEFPFMGRALRVHAMSQFAVAP